MRNLVLASLLGASASAFVLPSVGSGPVHFRITQPHSVTAVVPQSPNSTPVTTTFPTTPLQFVITDITWGRGVTAYAVELKANGTTVFVGRHSYDSNIKLNTGVLIPAGATVTATCMNPASSSPADAFNSGMTLSGYVQ